MKKEELMRKAIELSIENVANVLVNIQKTVRNVWYQ